MRCGSLLPGDLVRIRDERWVVVRHTGDAGAAILNVRGRDRTNLGTRATFFLPFEIVEPLPSLETPRRVRLRCWRRVTKAMLASATPSWQALRTPLWAKLSLLAFQLEPALAVTHGMASRILIADEVGLGKTVQAGLIASEILERTRHGRILVVAPASLREQWQEELRERFHLDAWLADSTSLARLGPVWSASQNPWTAHPVTITSIDFVKRPEVVRSLETLVWDAVILDEAHGLSGHSDRAAAAGALARRARTVVLLTATPHNGSDDAFDGLCRIGDLDTEFPLVVFRRTRQDAGLAISRRTVAIGVRPSLAEREMHRALMAYTRAVWTQGDVSSGARLAMTVLTRRACSSAASLVRSLERRASLLTSDGPAVMQQMALPMFDAATDDEPGSELAAPGLDDRHEESRRLEHILRLARRAQPAESKLRALSRFLRRIDEPAIVFTEYRDTLATLADALSELTPITLHGGLTAAERREALSRFTTGGARLLLATDAASEGLNLQQRCRLVINLELPWTPLRLEQRVGRVERIGQPRRVHAVHLLAADTAEVSLVARLVLRARRAAQAMDRLHSPTTEEQVARAVIGQEPADRCLPPQVSVRPDILLPILRPAAQAEAVRLERLRLLTDHPTDGWPDGRPPLTIRRGRRSNRGTLCGFRLVFTGADQQIVWETLLGAVAPRAPTVNAQCAMLNARCAKEWVEEASRKTLTALADALWTPLDLASRRERAIAAALEAERARLAANLLQPGLFDHRAERRVTAQQAVLEEALQRCRDRLQEIAHARQLVVEHRLAFAVVRR